MTSPLDPKHPSSTQETEISIKETDPSSNGSSVDGQETKKIDGKELQSGEASAKTQAQTSASSAEAQSLSREDYRKRLKQEEVEESQEARSLRKKSDSTEEEDKPVSRAEMRKQERKATRQLKVRVFPIWLRLIVIIVLCAAALVGGTMVGYGIIGKGNPMDVFNMHTWTHIRDIVYAKK